MSDMNIILIGFMGCGKTTVGMALAARLGWAFIDTDRQIEEEQGRTISSIFEEYGESEFRSLEKQCVASLSRKTRQVIATGGGVVKDPENVRQLKRGGHIVYLELSPESLYDRVKEDDTRPLLKPYTGEAKLDRIRELLAERRSMYETASSYQVPCDGLNPEQTVDRILQILKI